MNTNDKYNNSDKGNTLEEILLYIKAISRPVTAHELAGEIPKSRASIHSALKRLVLEGALKKQGKSPRVFYSLQDQATKIASNVQVNNFAFKNDSIRQTIENNYFLITPDGEQLSGISAFMYWCNARNYDIEKKSIEYYETFKHYDALRHDGKSFNAIDKIKTSFKPEVQFLNELDYLHPYSLPIFGRTKIAELVFNAKQNQDVRLMKQAFDIVVPEIEHFIVSGSFDALCFVPPTVKREVQFMKELQKRIKTNLPLVSVEKIKTKITVQQKSLKDINERIENADKTMVVTGRTTGYKKVLIIDDFTGSGATLNVLAKKIKQQKITDFVAGLTITGSMEGFEVVREV